MNALASSRWHEQVVGCVTAPWRLLVVVATEPGQSALALAEAIVERCNLMTGNRAKLFSAEKHTRGEVADLLDEARVSIANGARVVVAIDALTGSSTASAVAMSADAAIVCVYLGRSTTTHARKTVELLGREKVLGAVTLARDLQELKP
jgi:hypothetical protein